MIYVTIGPNDAFDLKKVIAQVAPQAFVAISDVDEVISPEFIPGRSKYRKVKMRKE